MLFFKFIYCAFFYSMTKILRPAAATPRLLQSFEWSVHSDLCGSDHFPVHLTTVATPPSAGYHPRWRLEGADWTKFASLAIFRPLDQFTAEGAVEHLTEIVVRAAEASLPTTSCSRRRKRVPWWNDACRDARRARRRALRAFQLSPTDANLATVRQLRAKARRVFKESRLSSWQRFLSTLNHSTPSGVVWRRIASIQGKAPNSIPGLSHAGSVVTEPGEVSEILASTFAEFSSSSRYDERFVRTQGIAERTPVVFPPARGEAYNDPFSMKELGWALSSAHDTSPGPDDIPYSLTAPRSNLEQENSPSKMS